MRSSCPRGLGFVACHAPKRSGRGGRTAALKFYELRDNLVDLARLIEYKARQHRVKVSDLASEGQLMTAIYADVLENEFISAGDRDTTLQRIDKAISDHDREQRKAAAATPEESTRPSRSVARRRSQRQRSSLLAVLAALSAVLATAVTAFVTQLDTTGEAQTSDREWWAIALVSIFVVGLVAILLGYRDRLEEEPPPEPEELTGPEFEAAVKDHLFGAGLTLTEVGRPGAPDFIVELNGRRIGVEAHGMRRMTRPVFRAQLLRAETILLNSDLDDLVVVYPAIPNRFLDEVKNHRVRIATLPDLADAIASDSGGVG